MAKKRPTCVINMPMEESFEPVPGARRRPFPIGLSPMLLQIRKEPFTQEGWIYEPKLDGMRCLAYVEDGKARLYSKSNREITSTFPALAIELAGQPTGVYDGEIVAHDDDGHISFERLQERWTLRKSIEVEHADRTNPVSFYCFDMLHLGRLSLMYVGLSFRKALILEHFKPGPRTKVVDSYSDGIVLFEVSKQHKFEGIVAKLATSTYKPGLRTADWQKIKYSQTHNFVIVGYRQGDGFMIAYKDKIAGYVSHGFGKADHLYLQSNLTVELEETVKNKKTIKYKPDLTIEVEFMEWTSKELLRFPVFKRFIHLLSSNDF